MAFPQTLKSLGDVIVLIPGIMGSVLQKDARDVWALSGSALASGLRSLGGSVTDLMLQGDSPIAESLGDGIVASRLFPDTHLLPGLWKIDGYSGISKAITEYFDARRGRNYFEFPSIGGATIGSRQGGSSASRKRGSETGARNLATAARS